MKRVKQVKGIVRVGIVHLMIGLFLLLVAWGPTAEAAEAKKWPRVTIGSSSMTGSYYPIATAWAEQLKKHANITGTPLAVGGSTAIINLIAGGQVQFSPCGIESAYDGYFGTGSFAGKGKQPIRAIMNGHERVFQLYVRADSPFKKPEDIRGKKFMYYEPGSASNRMYGKLLTEAYKIKESEYKRLNFKDTKACAEAVDEKLTDFGISGALPTMALMELSRSTGVRFIPISEEAQKYITKAYEPFDPGVVPKDIYGPGVPPENIRTVQLRVILACGADAPDDLIYEATRVILDYPEEFNRYCPLCPQYTDLKQATKNQLIPFHPGAIKYYKEKGVWDKEHEKVQQTLLDKIKK